MGFFGSGSLYVATLDARPSDLSVVGSKLILIIIVIIVVAVVDSAGMFGEEVGAAGRVVGLALLFLICYLLGRYLAGAILLYQNQLHLLMFALFAGLAGLSGVESVGPVAGGSLGVSGLNGFLGVLVYYEEFDLLSWLISSLSFKVFLWLLCLLCLLCFCQPILALLLIFNQYLIFRIFLHRRGGIPNPHFCAGR